LDFSKVEKEGEVGKNLLEKGYPIGADLGLIGEDFDLIEEGGKGGLELGKVFKGSLVVLLREDRFQGLF